MYCKSVLLSTASALLLLAGTASPMAAQQKKLLVNTNPASLNVYGGLHVGGGQWQNMTQFLQGDFDITSVEQLADLAMMLQYDALWVDQRFNATASEQEMKNLLAFIATGRPVVIMGENATTQLDAWVPWNNQILNALGGKQGELENQISGLGCLYGPVNAIPGNVLTAGVTTITLACGGYAVGGTALFDYNVATLWGDFQNVLTILDGNALDDLFAGGDVSQFRQNIGAFLSADPTVTPEPATLALLASGLGSLGAFRALRRRKARGWGGRRLGQRRVE